MYDGHYNIILVTIFSYYDSILRGMLIDIFSGSNLVLEKLIYHINTIFIWVLLLCIILIVSVSSIVGEIVGFADKEKVDLIILGTRGRTGFQKLLLGSVAEGVVNHSSCPVMIVR